MPSHGKSITYNQAIVVETKTPANSMIDNTDANSASRAQNDSAAASKSVTDAATGKGSESGGERNKFHRLNGVCGTTLMLFGVIDPDGRLVSCDVNANSAKAEITSRIQNTLSGNPIGATERKADTLSNSMMAAVLTNRPRTSEIVKCDYVTDVSDIICAI